MKKRGWPKGKKRGKKVEWTNKPLVINEIVSEESKTNPRVKVEIEALDKGYVLINGTKQAFSNWDEVSNELLALLGK